MTAEVTRKAALSTQLCGKSHSDRGKESEDDSEGLYFGRELMLSIGKRRRLVN